jgi:hypothetical protein
LAARGLKAVAGRAFFKLAAHDVLEAFFQAGVQTQPRPIKIDGIFQED